MCKVSVIIPYYNSEKTIIRAIDSVINQTYQDLELILINDGSKDMSKQIVDNYIQANRKIRIINISQINQGPAEARNNGIRLARGEYIAFLDADDSWQFNKLEIQMKYIEEYSADLISCNSNIMAEGKIEKKYYTREKIQKINYKMALLKYYTSTPCVIVRKSVLINAGCFPTDMRIGEDVFLFYRIIRSNNCFAINNFLTNIHKELYGRSGLTGDMKLGQKAIMDSIICARKENSIYSNKVGFLLFSIAYIAGIVKYWRRLIIVKLR